MTNNVCIKVLNIEHGKKVIEYLESLGGINDYYLNGNSVNKYYGITPENKIRITDYVDYKIKSLPTEKTFPRVMLVRQDKNDNWEQRFIISKIDILPRPYIAQCRCTTKDEFEKSNKKYLTCWEYAKEIDEPIQEQIVELTIKDISDGKGVGIPEHLIRIKK